eukprot:PhM_4_TR7749/c0_g1_i2/m.41804
MLRLLLSTHRTLCLYIFGLMCLYIHQIALVGPSASEHRIDDMWSLQSKARLYCLYLGLAPIVVMYTFFPSAWRNRRRRLIVLAILCPVVVVAALDYFSLWCAYREYERKMLCDFAVEWSDKFGQTNITHWLGLGTYLPIARTQDDTHRMIACEHDFDFFIDPKHHATVLSMIKRSGYHYEVVKGGDASSPPPSLWIFPPRTRWYAGHAGVLFLDLYFTATEESVSPLKQVVGCYGHPFLVPENGDELLEKEYGPTWRTPMCFHNWVACRLSG